MIIDRQQEGLFIGRWPPLVDGRIVLPEFTEAGAFPTTAGFGVRLWLTDEVGKMRADKGGDRLTMALETEAYFQFIGGQLKIGRSLQRYKIFKELAGFRGPIWPVAAPGELGAEPGSVF